ncbi:MAG: DNA polymerase [Thermococcales archaeon 44_46]|nr:MAG: DNA polymerase [Thermococcales archaeon 44_46]
MAELLFNLNSSLYLVRTVILDTDYITKDGKPIIRIFKKENGEFKIELDPHFQPYIYALLKDDSAIEEIKSIRGERHGKTVRVLDAEKVRKKFLGREVEVWKLIFEHPQDVPAMRDKIREHPAVVDIYEYDIPFAKRYLIDKGLIPMEGEEELKLLAFDIETFYHEGDEFGKGEIIMISYADEEEARVITWKNIDLPYVEVVSSEREMIKRFIQIVKEKDPDVIITYNGDNFDLPYLIKRAEKLGIRLLLGRDKEHPEPKIQRMGDSFAVEIKGRIHFDLFPVVRRTINLPTYTLEAVYEAVLGKTKSKLEAEEIAAIWETEESMKKLAQYSMEDAKATYELGKEFFPMEAELAKLIGQSVWDVSRSSTGNLVEWYLLRVAYQRNELAPNKPSDEEYRRRLRTTYLGGYVKEPERGLWENIVYLDFRSLYPSIIVTHNISPDTLEKEGCKNYDVAPIVGYKFCKDFPGFIPSILGDLINMRQEIKKKMKATVDPIEKKMLDYRQRAVKLLANSILPNEWLPIIEDREVKFVKIGEFIDSHIEKQRDRVKRVDNTEVLEVDNLYAFSFNRKSKESEVKKVKALIRHKYKGKAYEIQLSSGRKINITAGHSLFTVRNGEIMEVSGDEIRKGDLIVVPKRIKLDEKETILNIPELISGLPDKETADIVMTVPVRGRKNFFKGMLRTLRWIFGEENKRIRTFNRYLFHLEKLGLVRILPRGYEVINWEGLKRYKQLYERLAERVKYNGNKREYLVMFNDIKEFIPYFPQRELEEWKIGTLNGFRMNCILKVNEDFGRLLGYYVSEGYAGAQRNKTGGVSYSVKLYNEDPRVIEKMKTVAEKFFGGVRIGKNCVDIPKKMAYLVMKCLCGALAENKRIPAIIFNSPESVRWAFLETYFEGDGDVHPSKRFRLSTKSELLANQLVFLLNSLGISSVKIGFDSGVYRVYINEDLQFLQTSREKNTYYSNLIPKEVLEEVFGRKFQKNMTFEKFKELTEEGKLDREKAKLLEFFIYGDVVLDKVKSVEEKEYEGYVYDLSVEDNENFLVGFGLLYAHNSYYGYMGYPKARWYSKECAESVTAWGRYYIEMTIREIEEKFGFKVLYADSVSGESEIIIRQNGKIKFVKIKDLFSKVDYSIGEKEYCILEGVEALTLDDDGKLVWKPVPYVMRHRANKRMFRIWLTNSWYIDVTEDHSLIGYLNTSKKKTAKKIGERLKEVKPFELGKAVKSLICPNAPLKNENTKTNEIAVKFWELVGLIVGDGNWGGNSHWAEYYLGLSTGKDAEEIKQKLLEPLKTYGVISNYYPKNERGDFNILAKSLVRFMKRHFKDEKGRRKIPEFMYELPVTYIEAFLRGLFSADGTVTIRKGVPEIRLTNIDADFLREVRKLLWIVGISNSIFAETTPNRYNGVSTGTYSKHLRIKNKWRFAERIGFLIERKQKRLLEHLKSARVKRNTIDFGFDLVHVKKVEEIPYEGYVYDIEVEETHRFFANNILVHNTDGFYATIPGEKPEIIKKKAKEFLNYINSKLPGLLELEYEGFYLRGFFVTKKRYAVIDEEGRITTRGLEVVRRDWSEIAKETQAEVLEAILKEGSVEKAVEIVRDVVEKIAKYRVPLEKLVIHEQITRDLKDYKAIGPHVAIAKRLAARGIKVKPGTIISYIVLKGGGKISDRVILLTEYDPRKHKYDPDYYIENQVLPAVLRILEAFGYRKEDLRYQSSKQTGLDAWLKR